MSGLRHARASISLHGVTRHILLLSGSLRIASSNTALLHAASALAPPHVEASLFDGIGDLPHFNPDMDRDPAPVAVQRWRDALGTADAVLISTPEYAHGLPGVLKNALDWVVGSGEFMHTRVGLLNASAASTFAPAALQETLVTMMAVLVPDAIVTVPLSRRPVDVASILADPPAVAAIRDAMRALASAIAVSSA